MLTDSKDTKRVYRHPDHLWGAVVLAAVNGGFLLWAITQGGQADIVAIGVVCLAAVLAISVRLAWVAVVATENGVQVRNFFSSFYLPWSDIDRFEVDWWWLADVCVIHTVDGERRRATAIYEGGIRPNGSAKETVSALNHELQTARIEGS